MPMMPTMPTMMPKDTGRTQRVGNEVGRKSAATAAVSAAEARVHRRALSPDQGRRYHSDIRRIYILHERPPASSESRTIGPVERL
jgi:hypothetical protein